MNLSKFLLRIRPVELAEFLKKLLGISYRPTRVGARTFWLDAASNFGDRLLSDGVYEELFTACIRATLRPGDTFVDLGANEGYFSLLASELVGSEGRVFAIEPQARLWPVIIRNFQLNELTNYTLIPYAVGETDGSLDLFLYPSINTGATTAVRSGRRRLAQVQKTPVMRLDRIWKIYRIAKVSLLKIDIEGFELHALRSLGKGWKALSLKIFSSSCMAARWSNSARASSKSKNYF